MIFIEVVISMGGNVLHKLATAFVVSFHRRVLMLFLILDVFQPSIHAFFVLLLEGDDVREGRWRLRVGICLAG